MVTMGEPNEAEKRHALDAILRVVARHANTLQGGAFEELSAALSTVVVFVDLCIVVPDSPRSLRVYALSRELGDGLRFGARLPIEREQWQRLFVEQQIYFHDDVAGGKGYERALVGAGIRSYAAFPVRVVGAPPDVSGGSSDGEGRRSVAVLAFGFAQVEGCRSAPARFLQDVADLIGPSIVHAVQLARVHRLAMILETSSDALLAWDRQGKVTDANRAACVLTGRRRKSLIGTPIAELLDPVPRPEGPTPFAEGVRLSLLARTPSPFDEGGSEAPSSIRRVVVAASVSTVEGDPMVAQHALLRDLTHAVKAEEEADLRVLRIRELEEQHRTLLDNAPLIIFRLDPHTEELVYLNRHAERLLGIPTMEALGTRGFLRAAHADPEGAAAFDAAVSRAREGGVSAPYEARFVRRHGDEIMVRGNVYPLLTERGRVAAIEGVLADVSSEHAARTRLVQADRLSTLGTLAAGVAHEINNPAAFILLGLDLLDRTLAGPGVRMEPNVAASAVETLRELRESIRRIVDIARDLRLFASPPALDGVNRTVVDINRTVESALSLTRGQILERAQIERDLHDVPPVMMDDGRLGQVLVNLLVNAAQAIPKSYAAEHVVSVATRSDGATVEIEVRDTGVGIPEENMPRIWQPFFTTKSPDVGTGLGLSISREIVERAGGTIYAESPIAESAVAHPAGVGVGLSEPELSNTPPRPKFGTRFVIALPAAGNREPAPPRSAPNPGYSPPRVNVLIVEDEAPLARALAEEIGRLHEVSVAGGAEEALIAMRSQRYDVVLCDLRMPTMSGEALYSKVLAQDDATAQGFIFMTGVGFGADIERFLRESARPVLEKPFPAQVALETIGRVIKKRGIV
jgi:PAS domain S-box-containing protein